MGKDSLIKSTSKKSADEEEKKKTPKKAAAARKTSAKAKSATAKKTTKAKTAGASKTAPKAKKAAMKKAAPKAKKTAKKKAAPKTKKAATTKAKKAVKKAAPAKPKKAAAKKKPLTRKELVFKKFEAPKPGKLYTPSQPKETPAAITSPPYFAATDEAELKRLQGIQFRRYSAADLKTAADKAEVDKAAAEKAATEKAAAEAEVREKVEAEVEVGVSYDQPPATPAPADPMAKMFKYGIAGFAAIILLLIATSMMNTGNYYLKAENGSLEIWQGRFAPMGQDRLIVLSGMEAPEPIKEVYSKNDVYPLVFNFYVAKADELLAMPGMPDYEGIRDYLHKAQEYAATPELRSAVYSRLDSIEFMTLMIKTNVAVQKRTVESLEEALGYLRETRALELDEEQTALVASKTAAVQKMIDELKAQEVAEAEAADGK